MNQFVSTVGGSRVRNAAESPDRRRSRLPECGHLRRRDVEPDAPPCAGPGPQSHRQGPLPRARTAAHLRRGHVPHRPGGRAVRRRGLRHARPRSRTHTAGQGPDRWPPQRREPAARTRRTVRGVRDRSRLGRSAAHRRGRGDLAPLGHRPVQCRRRDHARDVHRGRGRQTAVAGGRVRRRQRAAPLPGDGPVLDRRLTARRAADPGIGRPGDGDAGPRNACVGSTHRREAPRMGRRTVG